MSWSVGFVRWGVCMGALVGVCTCALRRTVVSVLVVHLGGVAAHRCGCWWPV